MPDAQEGRYSSKEPTVAKQRTFLHPSKLSWVADTSLPKSGSVCCQSGGSFGSFKPQANLQVPFEKRNAFMSCFSLTRRASEHDPVFISFRRKGCEWTYSKLPREQSPFSILNGFPKKVMLAQIPVDL